MAKRDIGFCIIGILIGGFIVFALLQFQILPPKHDVNAYDIAYVKLFSNSG